MPWRETDIPALTPQAEKTWLRLKTHLDWSDGFALGFVFVPADQTLVELLRRRLQRICRNRVSELEVAQPARPSELVDEIMARVRDGSDLARDMRAPLWIELHQKPRDKVWQQARDQLLLRLNEHRELLRKRFWRPLVLVLPAGQQPHVRELAPDLWSIRDFSLEMPRSPWLAPAIPRAAGALEKAPLPPASENAGQAAGLLDEWRRLRGKQSRGRETLIAGWRTVDALLDERQLDEAAAVAGEVLQRSPRGETPQVLRDLSVSLDKVGDVARAQGRLAEAEEAYREGLDLRRQLHERVGETPEVLRDLSVSLNKVGDVAVAQGRLAEARQSYGAALRLLQRMDHVFPDRDYADELRQLTAKLEAPDTARVN